MSGRDAISAEVTRAILIESGHRCSVCGVPCPLERAHIVPWCRTRDNSFENLLCLCANCHERADKEDWGRKTLLEYKARPWVSRQNGLDARETESTRIRIEVDKEYEKFDEYHENLLRHALANFLNVTPGSIRIISKRKGSTILIVELPSEDARVLFENENDLKKALPTLPISKLERAGPIRVLLAVKSPMVRTAIKSLVKSDSEIEVVGRALSSSAIVSRSRESRPDVVLLQGHEGTSAITELKKLNPTIGILVLTSSQDEEYALRCVNSGARGILRMDCDPSDILTALRRIQSGGFFLPSGLASSLALSLGADASPSGIDRLSRREIQVMHMIAAGKSVAEIADKLDLSDKTINTHRSRILEKLDVDGTPSILRFALKRTVSE